MKFCYVDESGKGKEPILVVAGIIADSYKMRVTKNDWKDIITALSKHLEKPIPEFHTRHFYRGRGVWFDLDGDQRSKVMNFLLEWLKVRKHQVSFSAIDKSAIKGIDFSGKNEVLAANGGPRLYDLAALHLMLSIQKTHQSLKKNKGSTVLVFDKGSDESKIIELSRDAPSWTDSFYGYKRNSRKKNMEPTLNQIIDVPYFADSKDVALLQIADLFAYLLRHHAELQLGYTTEQYNGEKEKVEKWAKKIGRFATPDSHRWMSQGGCSCSEFFSSFAPKPLLRLNTDSG